MTGVTLLRAADRRPQPWKNGGGETRDVMIHPPGAGMETFDWRVSIAQVDRPGPFSVFAGVERVLTVIEGQLDLEIAGTRTMLDRSTAPLTFSGEAPVFGRPVDGPVHDLNVMTRQGSASVTRERIGAARRIVADANTQLLIVAQGFVSADIGTKVMLAPLDAVLLETAGSLWLSAPDGADILIVRHHIACPDLFSLIDGHDMTVGNTKF